MTADEWDACQEPKVMVELLRAAKPGRPLALAVMKKVREIADSDFHGAPGDEDQCWRNAMVYTTSKGCMEHGNFWLPKELCDGIREVVAVNFCPCDGCKDKPTFSLASSAAPARG